MLQFCANLSLLFTELPLRQRFAAAKAAGFEAVEIQFPYELPAAEIQQRLTEHALTLVLFNVPAADLLQGGEGLAAVPEKQTEFRQAVEQAVAYAQLLRPEAINVLPGRCLQPEREADYVQTLRDNLRYAADCFAPLGIKTVVEAINTHDMPGFLIASGEQLQRLLAEIDHPNLFIQYDLYHASMMQEDALAFLQQHLPRIGHIQFADCPGRGQPGTGQMDFAALFGWLANSDYSGWTGAEYRPQGDTLSSLHWLKIPAERV